MAQKRVSDQQFAESKHRYTDPRTGERVTSVTSIVGSLDTGDKLGAGAGAATKLMREGKNYREVWRAAADRGTRIHGYASLWAQGKSATVEPGDEPYVDAMARFCDDYTPTWLETERAIVHSLGYGGRFDGVAEIQGNLMDGYAMLDVKSGKHYLAELTLQLAGYRYADGMILYDAEGNAAYLEAMPHIDTCAGLYLHDDGTYDLIYVNADKAAFDAFTRLLAVKQWAASIK